MKLSNDMARAMNIDITKQKRKAVIYGTRIERTTYNYLRC
jgi:hypothetical protein